MLLLSKLFIKWTSKYIGKDIYGNKYYERKKQRYVVYKGLVEGSKVTPPWFLWLHFQLDKPPSNQLYYKWQKLHKPNASGTKAAFYPLGHINGNKNGKSKNQKHYQPWTPGQQIPAPTAHNHY